MDDDFIPNLALPRILQDRPAPFFNCAKRTVIVVHVNEPAYEQRSSFYREFELPKLGHETAIIALIGPRTFLELARSGCATGAVDKGKGGRRRTAEGAVWQ